MRSIKYLFLTSLALLMTACGSKTISVKDASIDDNGTGFKDFIQVVEKSYDLETHSVGTVDGDKTGISLNVLFKTLKDCEGFSIEDDNGNEQMYLLPKDKDGNYLKDDVQNDIKMRINRFEFNKLINAGQNGRAELEFSYIFPNDEVEKTFMKNFAGFDLYVNATKTLDKELLNIDSDINGDWDKLLDDYEALVNEYDKFVTKMKSGDIDYQSAMNAASKAQAMQEKLDAGKSEMNSKQIQRLGKIATKLTNIAAKAATINTDDIKSVNGVDLKDLGL